MLTLLFTLIAAAADDDPAAVVRRWLEAGAQGDLAQARSLVEPRCHDRPVGRVAAVHVLGAPLTLSSVEVGEPEFQGDQARVPYAVRGSLRSQSLTTTNDFLGQQVTIQIDELSLQELDINASVDLIHGPHGWKLTCAVEDPPSQAPIPTAPPTATP